jgi:MFS family permease
MIKELSKNRNIMVLMTTQTIFMFTAFLWWPYRSLYILELGATKELLGMLLTIETIANILFQFPGGILTDRWGRRKMLLISGALRIGSPLLYLLSTHWTHTAPGILLTSAGMLGLPANNALIAESIPDEKRGTGFAAYRTVTSVPLIITSLMGGVVVDYFGILRGCKYILAASTITAIFSFILRWRYIEETLAPIQTINRKEKNENILKNLKKLPREIWIITLVSAFSMFATKIMMSFMVIYGVEIVGLSTTQWGIIGTIVHLISTLITTPAGIIADRHGKKPLILASRTLNSISVLGYTFSQNFSQMLIVRSLTGVGGGLGGAMWGPMGGPIWQAMVADMSPPEERGKIVGLIGTISSLLSSPASWAGGYLFDNYSPNIPFQISFVLDTIGSLILVFFLKENLRKPTDLRVLDSR